MRDYDEEMEDARVPGEEAPTQSWGQARADLREVRPAYKGFRKSRLALPRSPQREADASGQPAVLRTEHRVMEVVLIIGLLIILAVTMKGDR